MSPIQIADFSKVSRYFKFILIPVYFKMKRINGTVKNWSLPIFSFSISGAIHCSSRNKRSITQGHLGRTGQDDTDLLPKTRP